jgi:hypothetical protein
MSSNTGAAGAAHQAAAGQDPARWFTAERRWPVARDPDGGLWLAAGADFDLVEVPESAGRPALQRLLGYRQAALAPGPVAVLGAGRCGFFVAPGARDDLPELLDWLDWGGIDLDLRAHGPGDRVRAPEPQQWLHGPLATPPEVIALLATIAEACWQHALATRRSAARVPAPRPPADGGSWPRSRD